MYHQETGLGNEIAQVGQGGLPPVGLYGHLCVVDALQKQQVDHLVLQKLDENRLVLEYTQRHGLRNYL